MEDVQHNEAQLAEIRMKLADERVQDIRNSIHSITEQDEEGLEGQSNRSKLSVDIKNLEVFSEVLTLLQEVVTDNNTDMKWLIAYDELAEKYGIETEDDN